MKYGISFLRNRLIDGIDRMLRVSCQLKNNSILYWPAHWITRILIDMVLLCKHEFDELDKMDTDCQTNESPE